MGCLVEWKDSHPMRILLAEDNEANRILVRSLLEREGHVLDFAENGLMALMCCESKKYDLILMDILMPVMDGVKTLRKLRRASGPNIQTPVFALTGYSSQADKQRYRQAGFDLVLTKPLRPNDLARAWSGYLKGDISIALAPSETPVENFSNVPLIEDEIIDQLLISGSCDEIRRIAERYWDSVRGLMSSIHENLALGMQGQNDALSTLRRSVHTLKGSSATIGLARLSRISASLQNAPPEKIAPLVLSLTETITPSAQSLDNRITQDSRTIKTDSVEAHSGDANAPIALSQSLP